MSQGLRKEPQCPVELRGGGITHIKGAELMETAQARKWCPRTPKNTQMGGRIFPLLSSLLCLPPFMVDPGEGQNSKLDPLPQAAGSQHTDMGKKSWCKSQI